MGVHSQLPIHKAYEELSGLAQHQQAPGPENSPLPRGEGWGVFSFHAQLDTPLVGAAPSTQLMVGRWP